MKPVQPYLLGTLEPAAAAAFEDKYFADDLLFAELQRTEERLITHYLEGRLSSGDRKLFEARYLRIPELREKLEQVRALHKPRSWTHYRLVWAAAAAALVLVTASTLLYWTQKSPTVLTAQNRPPFVPPLSDRPAAAVRPVELRLAPLLTKDAAVTINKLPAPSAATPVDVTLELPPHFLIDRAKVTIQRLDANGAGQSVWEGTAVPSGAARTRQPKRIGGSEEEAGNLRTVVLPPGLLTRADYLLNLKTPDGGVIASYYFRVTEAH
ncbi:MAG: hypothetical protein ABI693_17480 [Bryobacteraceae bacterium]